MYNNTYFSRDAVKMGDSNQNQPTTDIDKRALTEYTVDVALPAETLF